jgi:hypothetical protein
MDDAKFSILTSEYAKREAGKLLDATDGRIVSSRNNNKKNITSDEITWDMFARGVDVLQLPEIDVELYLCRPQYADLRIKEVLSLADVVQAPPPPEPIGPMSMEIPTNIKTMWDYNK